MTREMPASKVQPWWPFIPSCDHVTMFVRLFVRLCSHWACEWEWLHGWLTHLVVWCVTAREFSTNVGGKLARSDTPDHQMCQSSVQSFPFTGSMTAQPDEQPDEHGHMVTRWNERSSRLDLARWHLSCHNLLFLHNFCWEPQVILLGHYLRVAVEDRS